MVDVKIAITQKNRQLAAERLNILLANEYVLYTKTLKFHWNVAGLQFGSLHKLFNDQYEQLLKMIDEIAERILQLGFPAQATLQEFLEVSSVQEEPGKYPDEKQMIKTLLYDHETVILLIRDDIDDISAEFDAGTNNFLSDLIEKHEKMAWMLRAHLQ